MPVHRCSDAPVSEFRPNEGNLLGPLAGRPGWLKMTWQQGAVRRSP